MSNKTDSKKSNFTTVFYYVVSNKTYNSSDRVAISNIKINSTASVEIQFSVPMKKTVSPLFNFEELSSTNSTLVLDWIPKFLSI